VINFISLTKNHLMQININDISDLPSTTKKLLEAFPDKKIFAFYGQMGAGKTTFIKSLCEALGVNNTVSSPTFSIVNEYLSEKGEKIFHFDFYRINSEAEAYDMGYEDYFYSNAYCFIEWPERIAELLPEDHVKVNITVKDQIRAISANNN
jgi:tRNA threonylcarbamoyladenosine biosynthesis protein TsaE